MDSSADTAPITESYLHLSHDHDARSDTTARGSASFDTTELVGLAKKIDDAIDDDTDIEITEFHDDASPIKLEHPMISSHATPLAMKTRDANPRISLDELTRLLQPMINEEFRGFKQTLKEMLTAAADKPKAATKQPVTFVTPQRHTLSQSDIEQNLSDPDVKESPGTTPPNSQDNIKESTLLDNEDDYSRSYLLKTIRNSEVEQMRLEIEQLKQQNEQLKQQNEQLRAEKPPQTSSVVQEQVDQLKQLNNELSIKLEDSKQYNKELRNEMAYVKSNSAQVERLIAQIDDLKAQLGDPKHLVTAETLEKEFEKYYDKLGLAQVDKLTKVQMSNMLKNLTLTLIFSTFDQLPQNMTKITKYTKIVSQFLDRLHELIHGPQEFKPSLYLRSDVSVEAVQACLDELLLEIKHYVPE